jgi:hypothetical protein
MPNIFLSKNLKKRTSCKDLDVDGTIILKLVQGDQNASVHLTITIQKLKSNVQSVPPPRARGTLDSH